MPDEETYSTADFLESQMISAWNAGWGTPEMDDYDRYDELKERDYDTVRAKCSIA